MTHVLSISGLTHRSNPPSLSFNFMASFSTNCCCMHTCICVLYVPTHTRVYAVLNIITCSVYVLLLICMFSELSALPRGRLHLALPSFTRLPVVLCVRVRPCGLFPIHVGVILFSSCLDSCVGEILCVWLLVVLEDTNSEQFPWSSGSCSLFITSPGEFPEP